MATKKASSAKKSQASSKKNSTKKTVASAATVKKTTTEAKEISTPKQRPELKAHSLPVGAFVAEFVGTFILAAIALVTSGGAIPLGFALVAIVLAIGAISGAHVNPLITVGAWITGRLQGRRAIGYVISQALGAMLALVVLTAFSTALPKPENAGQLAMFGQQQQQLFEVSVVKSDTPAIGFIILAEFIAATIFSFIVASVSQRGNDYGAQALTVGFGLFTALTVAGGAAVFVNGSVIANPAIALSLNAIEWSASAMWLPILVYILTPVAGGVIGFVLQDVLQKNAKAEA